MPERLPSAEAIMHFQTDASGRLAGDRFPILHLSRTTAGHRSDPYARPARARARSTRIPVAVLAWTAKVRDVVAGGSSRASRACASTGSAVDRR